MLAAGIGNIHGKYPENWEGLSFETLDAIQPVSYTHLSANVTCTRGTMTSFALASPRSNTL